jgi:hypothetical protein
VLRRFTSHGRGRQSDIIQTVRKRADLDLCNAGNDVSRSNRYQQRIWPGLALKKDIGAAHMRRSRGCQGRRK